MNWKYYINIVSKNTKKSGKNYFSSFTVITAILFIHNRLSAGMMQGLIRPPPPITSNLIGQSKKVEW
jgi:hypothetical protein